MKINLSKYYRGRPSREQLIAPGIYGETDPALMGLAQYLVHNGHASIVAEPDAPQPLAQPEPDTPTYTESALNGMTKAELITVGDAFGLTLAAPQTNAAMVQAILEAQG